MTEEQDGRALRREAREKYDAMTLAQIKKVCDQSWLETSGSREDMIERLVGYDAEINDWPVSVGFVEPS